MNHTKIDYKKEFLIKPGITFLNHGSFGATPKKVFQKYQQWQLQLEAQPVEFLGRRHNDLLKEARTHLAKYLNTNADDLVYVTNSSQGINIIARSLLLHEADEVLMSDHEYGAMERTWQFMANKKGFQIKTLEIHTPIQSKEEFLENLFQAVTERTKVIYISHITSPTAIIFPIKEICEKARARGILTIIDGAHAPGQVFLDISEMKPDFYVGNLHKWLCAPKGAGFLYANPSVQHLLEPLLVSWGWHSDTPGYSKFIDEQEWQGTRDISAFLTVPEAIHYQQINHWNEIQQLCHLYTQTTQKLICALLKTTPLHPDSQEWFLQMGASPIPYFSEINTLQSRLYDQYHIEIPIVKWKDRYLIRFSFQAYNCEEEIHLLENALIELVPRIK